MNTEDDTPKYDTFMANIHSYTPKKAQSLAIEYQNELQSQINSVISTMIGYQKFAPQKANSMKRELNIYFQFLKAEKDKYDAYSSKIFSTDSNVHFEMKKNVNQSQPQPRPHPPQHLGAGANNTENMHNGGNYYSNPRNDGNRMHYQNRNNNPNPNQGNYQNRDRAEYGGTRGRTRSRGRQDQVITRELFMAGFPVDQDENAILKAIEQQCGVQFAPNMRICTPRDGGNRFYCPILVHQLEDARKLVKINKIRVHGCEISCRAFHPDEPNKRSRGRGRGRGGGRGGGRDDYRSSRGRNRDSRSEYNGNNNSRSSSIVRSRSLARGRGRGQDQRRMY